MPLSHLIHSPTGGLGASHVTKTSSGNITSAATLIGGSKATASSNSKSCVVVIPSSIVTGAVSVM